MDSDYSYVTKCEPDCTPTARTGSKKNNNSERLSGRYGIFSVSYLQPAAYMGYTDRAEAPGYPSEESCNDRVVSYRRFTKDHVSHGKPEVYTLSRELRLNNSLTPMYVLRVMSEISYLICVLVLVCHVCVVARIAIMPFALGGIRKGTPLCSNNSCSITGSRQQAATTTVTGSDGRRAAPNTSYTLQVNSPTLPPVAEEERQTKK